MINLGGYDFELETIGKEPQFGFSTEYREFKTISGKIRRDAKGKRFNGVFTYAYLTDLQIANLNTLLNTQKTNGYIAAEIDTAGGVFNGDVYLTVDNSQTRFSAGKWLNWKIVVEGIELI